MKTKPNIKKRLLKYEERFHEILKKRQGKPNYATSEANALIIKIQELKWVLR